MLLPPPPGRATPFQQASIQPACSGEAAFAAMRSLRLWILLPAMSILAAATSGLRQSTAPSGPTAAAAGAHRHRQCRNERSAVTTSDGDAAYLRPNMPDAVPKGSQVPSILQRKTQAPMLWRAAAVTKEARLVKVAKCPPSLCRLNLHKQHLMDKAPAWDEQRLKAWRAQRVCQPVSANV